MRRDQRRLAIALVVLGVIATGVLLDYLPGRGTEGALQKTALPGEGVVDPFAGLPRDAANHARGRRETAEAEPPPLVKVAAGATATSSRIDAANGLLQKAAVEIQAKRYQPAIALLHQAHPLLKDFPQAYVMIGRALEGKADYRSAQSFYLTALDKDPYLAEAYWGFATASESLGELERALGAMRSFLHTDPNPDPQRLKIAQARSALWEWESKLGRGPWGDTQGVPPGMKPEELRRDDRGVAVLMPLPGTEKPDGSAKYEIKHQDKFKIFKAD